MSGFVERHIGPKDTDIAEMLAAVGYASLDDLIAAAVPGQIRDLGRLDVPEPLEEHELLDTARELASQNTVVNSMIGQGYYDTITPSVILRNVLENPGWYTSYTPYQPEISQGRLEALINFQTMVVDLTGMEIANASMLDEGTAAAEAMAMCRRLSKHDSDVFFVDTGTHPQTIEVVETRAQPLGIKVVIGDARSDDAALDAYAVLLQNPSTTGGIYDDTKLIASLHERGGMVVVASDLLALTLMKSPGEMGADVVVGSAQRFGVPMGYGGPHAGFLAAKDEHKRTLPGRLAGVSKDAGDRVAYRLTLQTREQHIRREKATSNICTAQVLLAVIAGFYAVYHGPDGLAAIARQVHGHATAIAASAVAAGLEVVEATVFDTVAVKVPGRADDVLAAALQGGINLRRIDDSTVGISCDETTTGHEVDVVLAALGVDRVEGDSPIPAGLRRISEFMTHPVFSMYRSETEMMRYLRRLADFDIGLDRSMIPLGSCTMKLNATTEMIPITWPEFGKLHPFAPADQAAGYARLVKELEEDLVEITGYAAVSLQPNAGSQGEFAGLLAIRAYHAARGEGHRNICLIPSSAHGTNPASAAMAGMKVVVVACDEQGNVDVDDLRAKATEHGDNLAALMVTYPSTHGVFEERIRDVCDIVHEHGGQVYLDGANLNAMVGLAKPGEFGADVSHLNLHKTFTIPHGGGGPGVGPIGVGDHLAPYLPGHGVWGESPVGAVSSAPYGSASILPISWAYIRMMGPDGLQKASEVAILNANYVATRLEGHYPVLYRGLNDLIAHECILDINPIHHETGVTVADIAKRLIDYGFHAPTVSFPVAGTLMVEPTESESKEELDRFIEAMIHIREEIAEIERGEVEYEDSLLFHAPHTAEDLMVEEWDRPYRRERAAYPVPSLRHGKYWVPVSRVDDRYGDRNVVCSCPPIEDYM